MTWKMVDAHMRVDSITQVPVPTRGEFHWTLMGFGFKLVHIKCLASYAKGPYLVDAALEM